MAESHCPPKQPQWPAGPLDMAGVTLADIDTVAPLYDAFTIAPLLIQLEDLGFCPKGEGGPVRRQRSASRPAAASR